MLPESPVPVAVAAVLLGFTVARHAGNGPESDAVGRTVAVTVVPAVATAAVAVVVWTTPVEFWLWTVVAVVGVAAPLAPLADGFRLASRRPGPTEESRLTDVPDRDVRDVRVVAANGRIDGYAVSPISGAVGVSEAALDSLSREEVAALVAHERAHHEGMHVFLRAGASIGWLAVGSLGVVATFPGSTLTAVAIFALLAGERVVAVTVARYTEYAADARAAELTSRAAVVSLLESLAAAESDQRSWYRQVVSAHPAYDRRLDRLAE